MSYFVLTMPHTTGLFTCTDYLLADAEKVKGREEVPFTFKGCDSEEEAFQIIQEVYRPEVLFLFGLENLWQIRKNTLYSVRPEEIRNWEEEIE